MLKENFLRFVTLDDVETQVHPWGRLQWLSEPRVTGTTNMATGIVTLNIGKGHERHNHIGCEEILFVLDGEGEQTIEIDGKKETRIVKKGELIHVPEDLYHSTINTGTKPMVFLAVYQYAGPEAALRDLPECIIEPPKNQGI